MVITAIAPPAAPPVVSSTRVALALEVLEGLERALDRVCPVDDVTGVIKQLLDTQTTTPSGLLVQEVSSFQPGASRLMLNMRVSADVGTVALSQTAQLISTASWR